MPRTDLTEADILAFVFAGCNAAEVAAYSGTAEAVAQARINHALRDYATPAQRETLQLHGKVAA